MRARAINWGALHRSIVQYNLRENGAARIEIERWEI